MASFTGLALDQYADRAMTAPKRGIGPWGAAIVYWLGKKQWVQADLIRQLEEIGLARGKNTISRACHGRDVNTATLDAIAKAFDVAPEFILVSPEWIDNQLLKSRVIHQAVLQALTDHQARPEVTPTGKPDSFEVVIDKAKGVEETRRKKNPPKPAAHKTRKRK